MEKEEVRFELIITAPAQEAFFEILEYLGEKYSLNRAIEIANEIQIQVQSLSFNPERGRVEHRLRKRANQYRFILYQRSSRADIKIIYFIDQGSKTVYITDFFPTEKDDRKISG